MTSRVLIIVALTGLALPLVGCIGQTSEEPPIVPIRNMYTQSRYDPQERGRFFQDGRAMRPMVPGTVAREMDPEISVATGRLPNDSGWVLEVPEEVIRRNGGMGDFAARGQERYDIYCAPCHGASGDGQGPVTQRAQALAASGEDPGSGLLNPPTFHDDALRHIPDGQLYATITHGVRNMPAYDQSIPLDDRWAIVAYVRALQVSQATRRTAMNTMEPTQ